MEMNEQVKAELTPTGKLRAAINMSNFLLVTGKAENGDPTGVSPDMAAEVARRLDVPLQLIPYPNPGALGDDADSGNWDIGNIGAEPQRAEKIAFSAAYCEIEATYLVPAGSPIETMADVDKPGVRISVTGRAAYGLWLQNNIKHAELVKTDSLDSAYEKFVTDKLDVLAGLRPRLISDVKNLPGARILDGQFSAVQQAIGTPKKNAEAAKWLAAFVEEAKASGMVAGFIAKHNVEGLSVAPPA
ncbi:MAG: transporter substrate-binding domain-containing protein [Hyphomicrobiaceae bacterium]